MARPKRAPLRKSQPSLQMIDVAKAILTKWGIQPGKGLGPNAQGITHPILPHMRPKHSSLGANSSGDPSTVQE